MEKNRFFTGTFIQCTENMDSVHDKSLNYLKGGRGIYTLYCPEITVALTHTKSWICASLDPPLLHTLLGPLHIILLFLWVWMSVPASVCLPGGVHHLSFRRLFTVHHIVRSFSPAVIHHIIRSSDHRLNLILRPPTPSLLISLISTSSPIIMSLPFVPLSLPFPGERRRVVSHGRSHS